MCFLRMLLCRLPGPDGHDALADLSAEKARLQQELADRNVALRNLKSQVQQLNADFHSVKDQVVQAEAQLLEVQESTYTAQQDAERAKNEVGCRTAGGFGRRPSSSS
jgi:septal ring factor EnvC (AmiA/AmiB activator)